MLDCSGCCMLFITAQVGSPAVASVPVMGSSNTPGRRGDLRASPSGSPKRRRYVLGCSPKAAQGFSSDFGLGTRAPFERVQLSKVPCSYAYNLSHILANIRIMPAVVGVRVTS